MQRKLRARAVLLHARPVIRSLRDLPAGLPKWFPWSRAFLRRSFRRAEGPGLARPNHITAPGRIDSGFAIRRSEVRSRRTRLRQGYGVAGKGQRTERRRRM